MVEESNDLEWLTRLSAAEWLLAAGKELGLAYERLRRNARREGVTYARRAAGMALNAALRRELDPTYGRSYMDHVKALRDDERAPVDARAAARRLVAAPMAADLVTLGPGPVNLADDARAIVDYCRAIVGAGDAS
jgi:HEPN domain-containing protein